MKRTCARGKVMKWSANLAVSTNQCRTPMAVEMLLGVPIAFSVLFVGTRGHFHLFSTFSM
jgi:hypothetical protein